MQIYKLSFLPFLLACQPQWVDVNDPNNLNTDINIEDEENEEETEEQFPPELDVSWTETAYPGQTVRFDARSSKDPERGDLSFIWQCSNGDTFRAAVITVDIQTEDLTCELTASSSISSLSSSGTYTTTILTPEDEAKWTVMVYIAGDNNLEEAGIIDINEMEMVGSNPEVNIVVELDRSEGFYTGHDNWTGAKRFYIVGDSSDEIASIEMADLGNVDSGSPEQISDFFTWGAAAFPAERYALIMWNHGWSWSFTPQTVLTKGIMSDDQTGNDISVANGELRQILQDWTETVGQPIDLLGMDACIMQSWEIATEVSDYASVYVASQDYVSWNGWNYTDTLQDLVNTPEMTPLELGESISLRFWETDDLTISVVDLEEIPVFNEYLNNFAETLSQDNPRMMFQAARNSYSYDGSNSGDDHDLLGLVEYITENHENPDVQEQGQYVMDHFELLVPTNYVQEFVDTANGLSIYSPPRRNTEMSPQYANGSWAINNFWDELLEAAYAQ